MNRILKILPFLLLCAFALQVMPVGAQQQMFLQRTQQSAPTAGLLDSYKGAAFAAAPDVLLYSTYSATDDIPGSQTNGQPGQWSVAVLRDFDDAIKSFTPSQVADGTANTWVQALGPSDGFVRRWYDQSVTALDVSNLNHADQESTPNMPKLFDSSTGLILENGKAAMEFDGVNHNLILDIEITARLDLYSVIQTSDNFGVQYTGDNPGKWVWIVEDGSTSTAVSSIYSLLGYYKNNSLLSTPTRDDLHSEFSTGNQILTVVEGTVTQNWTRITFNRYDFTLSLSSKTSLSLIYDTNQSSNRPGIETAINNEYNIYP